MGDIPGGSLGYCRKGDGGIRVVPRISSRRNVTSSTQHQLHSSPGSSERMIGCEVAWACAVA